MSINPAHLHLALNHLPVLGVLFGTILLAVGTLAPGRHDSADQPRCPAVDGGSSRRGLPDRRTG